MEKNKEQNQEMFMFALVIAVGAILFAIARKLFRLYKEFSMENPVLTNFVIGAVILAAIYFIYQFARYKYLVKKEEDEITNGKAEPSVFAGISGWRKKIFVNQSFRKMHTQVIGTTNAGKTESVIVPWAIDDIEKGHGLILIDGKGDRQLLNKIYAYVKHYGREKDFRILSLSDLSVSHTYNPLIARSVDQTTEKIMNSFTIENEYYRDQQCIALQHLLEIFKEVGEQPTFIRLREVLLDQGALASLLPKIQSKGLVTWATNQINMNKDKRMELVSGLIAKLSFFSTNEVAPLFNTTTPSINVSEALKNNQILYFQLPVLQSPILGKAVAKMVLQDLQSAVAERHASELSEHDFFSIYLDDFTEYMSSQFESILNKSRSANIGVVLCHQAIGDLEKLGEDAKKIILVNTNLKIFMRTNEPDSAEYFSKTVGTKQTTKVTKRQVESLFGTKTTDDGSIREVEEFIYHPNLFKSGLGLGEAVMILPHDRGAKSVKLRFAIRKNLSFVPLPKVPKTIADRQTDANKVQAITSLASLAAGEV